MKRRKEDRYETSNQKANVTVDLQIQATYFIQNYIYSPDYVTSCSFKTKTMKFFTKIVLAKPTTKQNEIKAKRAPRKTKP